MVVWGLVSFAEVISFCFLDLGVEEGWLGGEMQAVPPGAGNSRRDMTWRDMTGEERVL
jgi:hypothetical protein